MKTMSPIEELRHSCSHVLAAALLRLYPDTQLDIGPPTEQGFYYDVDLDHQLDASDLEKIEAEMQRIIKENQRFIGSNAHVRRRKKKFKLVGRVATNLGALPIYPTTKRSASTKTVSLATSVQVRM